MVVVPMDEEFDELYADPVRGWGSLGHGSENEALRRTISIWAEHADDPEAIVWLCLEAFQQEWSEPKVAALEAFVQVRDRFPTLPRRTDVIGAVESALEHTDPTVRVAARTAWEALARDRE